MFQIIIGYYDWIFLISFAFCLSFSVFLLFLFFLFSFYFILFYFFFFLTFSESSPVYMGCIVTRTGQFQYQSPNFQQLIDFAISKIILKKLDGLFSSMIKQIYNLFTVHDNSMIFLNFKRSSQCLFKEGIMIYIITVFICICSLRDFYSKFSKESDRKNVLEISSTLPFVFSVTTYTCHVNLLH